MITDCPIYDEITSAATQPYQKWIEVGGVEDPFFCNCTLTNTGFPAETSVALWVDGGTGEVIDSGNPVSQLGYTWNQDGEISFRY